MKQYCFLSSIKNNNSVKQDSFHKYFSYSDHYMEQYEKPGVPPEASVRNQQVLAMLPSVADVRVVKCAMRCAQNGAKLT